DPYPTSSCFTLTLRKSPLTKEIKKAAIICRLRPYATLVNPSFFQCHLGHYFPLWKISNALVY
ncbi:MAG TPA: hypothetical protein VHT73_08835, partial [Thermodesulfobacteriota bacterium]|nr:hypothetical protein [Thermodesulfobacteriota bacterium]